MISRKGAPFEINFRIKVPVYSSRLVLSNGTFGAVNVTPAGLSLGGPVQLAVLVQFLIRNSSTAGQGLLSCLKFKGPLQFLITDTRGILIAHTSLS
jgi:hypothetical protein